ncbi:hypothetical protein SB4_16370 [Sphingomonas sanguinis]|uniref:Uncharacterized protein n=1 Tax=Sphingomonas sanguinis TaxID=33051 RepID=A0A147ILV2_9SPHN|nr:hypothetical protein SB4_16370 [Sphingomonas sanguinis]
MGDRIWVSGHRSDNTAQGLNSHKPSRASPAEPSWRRSSTVTPRIWWSVWELPIMNCSVIMRLLRRMFK